MIVYLEDQNFESLSIITIDGPFIVGFDNNDKLYKVYNYELE